MNPQRFFVVLVPLTDHASQRNAAGGRANVPQRQKASRAALDAAARLAGAPHEAIERPLDAAPRIPGGWFASLSNTRLCAAAVVSDIAVGLDAEPLGRPRLTAARTRLRETGELQRFEAGAERTPEQANEAVLSLWTAKEAVLKRAGVGIAGFERARLVGPTPTGCRFTFEGADVDVTLLTANEHRLALAHAANVQPEVRIRTLGPPTDALTAHSLTAPLLKERVTP